MKFDKKNFPIFLSYRCNVVFLLDVFFFIIIPLVFVICAAHEWMLSEPPPSYNYFLKFALIYYGFSYSVGLELCQFSFISLFVYIDRMQVLGKIIIKKNPATRCPSNSVI